MATAKPEIEVLRDAETKLRELVSSAAAAGDYPSVIRRTALAQSLHALAESAESTSTNDGNGSADNTPGPAAPRHDSVRRSSHALTNSPSTRTAATATRRPGRRPAKGDYPKFFRRGQLLVKIGWSRRERQEYEHKAPRAVIDALTAAITRRMGKGKLFTAEELFPLRDAQDGGEIPGYQAYVALAWFKHAALVKQHGRRGYSVGKATPLAKSVQTVWARLVETDH